MKLSQIFRKNAKLAATFRERC